MNKAAQRLGRLGGKSRSEAKINAVRKNVEKARKVLEQKRNKKPVV